MKTFSIAEIAQRVQKIKDFSHDPEMAHSMEDDLRKKFIESIAQGDETNLKEKAMLILKTEEFNFPRWCA